MNHSWVAILLLLCLGWTSATIGPHPTFTKTPTECPSAFGLANVVTCPRGGEVTLASADDVEAAILKAGADQTLVVIDFTASWCGPCQQIAPIYKQLSEEHPDVVFLKVDVDENPETAAKYSVSAMPTFVFIKGGEVVERLMGANPGRLEEMISELK
ncbi:Thioredoxin H-type [Seminavis robusta]|uniref:Thioredoxin H-type n=1 Tax=Seminavis robusta TaxID=568900 RepID=A0A9N8H575_9STRA|nr:Thioredoxin H-type [Seminavis robusta]|eukprot:Sro79_g042810.1 Thioredoxin H-type (157) ;mRNA; r:86545-87314